MLTIPTNKEQLVEIAEGKKTKKMFPTSKYWCKRFFNLLKWEVADDETERRLDELERTGDFKELEATLQSGSTENSPAVIIKFTLTTVKDETPNSYGVFQMNITKVVEVKNMDNQTANTPETGEIEHVEGTIEGTNKNALTVRKYVKMTGICKYCGQIGMIELPEGSTVDEANEEATRQCNCPEAIAEGGKVLKMEAAKEWASNIFADNKNQLAVIESSITATFNGDMDFVNVKIGKKTHKIDRDSDGMIRIRSTYKESNEETF